jgi:hypothetical protein
VSHIVAKFVAVTLIALAAICFPVFAQTNVSTATRAAEPPIHIKISAQTIDAFDARDVAQRRFGALEFRGGLELTSPYKEFGGLSGLRMLADGEHFIAVSDKGRWLRGRIAYKEGRPIGITDAEMAPVLGPDGRALAARGWFDTESVADDGAGTLYVGIERANRIMRFDYGRSGLLARGQPVPVPTDIGKLPHNKGLECLAVIPKGQPGAGTLIAISERGLDAAGNLKAFLIGGPGPGEFSVVRSDDFDATDCVVGPAGDLFLLERRFSWAAGVAMRLRRIPVASMTPGARVDGRVLMTADMGFQIDNMEGLGLHRDKAGDIVLTMVSDDNFSILQRTILLQFTVLSE